MRLIDADKWIVVDDDYVWDAEDGDEYYVVLECECPVCHKRTIEDRPEICPNCGTRVEI